MKHNYLFKSLLTGLILASGSIAYAQNLVQPIVYYVPGAGGLTNSFLSFVGERFEVTYPPIVAGDKVYTTANNGSGATTNWGGFPGAGGVAPIINDTLINYTSDSIIFYPPVTVNMTGKVALIYRGSTYFTEKAAYCQLAGALACIIVNNIAGAPVGMALSTGTWPTVTIPVFMLSNTDGNALNAQLHDGVPVTVSIFNWGQDNLNDLGFVGSGMAQYANGAIPYYELSSAVINNPMPYMGLDGAYVANFGINDAINVRLKATTTFTPTGSSTPTVIKVDSVALDTFHEIDSIWGMFCYPYNIDSSITGTGTVNVLYYVNSYPPDSSWSDQYLYDNYINYSFQVTDNIYCKGKWDMVNNVPFVSSWEGVGAPAGTTNYTPYLWGPTYYVNKGMYAKNSIFSLYEGISTGVQHFIDGGTSMSVYLFKWADSIGVDGFMENAELELQGVAIKTFAGAGSTDTSFGLFTAYWLADTTGSDHVHSPLLQDTSWYWVAGEMEQSSGKSFLIGIDGQKNAFPRFYARDTFESYLEYYAPIYAQGDKIVMEGDGASFLQVVPFDGVSHTFEFLDSTVYANTPGLVPNISLSTSNSPILAAPTVTKVSEFKLFPNPASTTVNVSLSLEKPVATVSYKILSSLGTIVSSETHSNVLSETYTYNTEKLANGNYFMVVIAGDKPMFKKFTVLR